MYLAIQGFRQILLTILPSMAGNESNTSLISAILLKYLKLSNYINMRVELQYYQSDVLIAVTGSIPSLV